MHSESESSLEEDPSASLLRNTAMEAQAEHAKFKRYKTIYSIMTVLGLVLIVLTFIWSSNYAGGYSLSSPNTEFNWHPLLMVTGMVFLYSQSILIYRTNRNVSKFKVKCIHAGLHIVILILASIALKAVFDSHNFANPPIANLYTLHSWLGILTFSLFCFQLVLGFGTFLYPGAAKNIRAAVLPYHVIIGSAGFVMSIVTAALGYTEKAMFTLSSNYQNLPFSAVMLNFIGLVLVIFGAITIYLVNDRSYKREEIIEDEVALAE
ncbi:hypothetical protein WA026_011887 [Henosepilachna vigintioctopunctata]|uniref:Cytochrome b561 domain-containing protein n=1 Tax=Henosepilachna vigintioctopunctata TaxID=420089 RepID=A0AAW1UHH0_9CUCU